MDDKKTVNRTSGSRRLFIVAPSGNGAGMRADTPPAAGDTAYETDKQECRDGGVRMREYTITAGRLLEALEEAIEAGKSARVLRLIR